MPDYFIFGGCLRSELSFPELTRLEAREPNWTLRIGALSRDDDAEVLSDVEFSPKCRVRVTRGEGWLRYSHSCTGSFEVFADGRRILWQPAPTANLDGARADLVSRVLLYCVDRSSVVWLHGSACRIGDNAVAFLGPSGAGKSTLALALTRGGAQHLCDDTLPVATGTTPFITASDGVIRVCSDSRSRLAPDAAALRRESDGKFVLSRGGDSATFDSPTPGKIAEQQHRLAAIYVLRPPDREGAAAVSRRFIKPTAAVSVLMHHIKLSPVVKSDDPSRILEQIGAIANSVPVYELAVGRDWSRLDEAVKTVIGWHTGTRAAEDVFTSG